MSDTAKNLIFLFFAIVICGLAYWLYSNQGLDFVRVSKNQQISVGLEQETAQFISRLRILSDVDLEVTMFDDLRFTQLRSFSTPVPELKVGRENPFLKTNNF